jgi:hypothetical protein
MHCTKGRSTTSALRADDGASQPFHPSRTITGASLRQRDIADGFLVHRLETRPSCLSGRSRMSALLLGPEQSVSCTQPTIRAQISKPAPTRVRFPGGRRPLGHSSTQTCQTPSCVDNFGGRR